MLLMNGMPDWMPPRRGYIPIVLSGAAPAIRGLFQDAVVWDAFIAVARLQSKAA
jgi:hypothetical protein